MGRSLQLIALTWSSVAPMCSHTGIRFFIFRLTFIALKLTFVSFARFNMVLMYFGRGEFALAFTFHCCKKN
ncbi:hypothetical protein BC629DRAFT_688671 [Irpex lacteus]|nr:hypothetical protein BC629DRAFT_688671 [Irpex lacteus]